MKVVTSQKDCLIWSVSWFWPNVIRTSSEFHIKFVFKIYVFSKKKRKHLTFLLYTKIAYDLRICHEFDSMSLKQDQISLEEKGHKLCPVSIFLILKISSHKDWRVCPDFYSRPLGYAMILIEGHLYKLKVTGWKSA